HRRVLDALDAVIGIALGAHQLDHRQLRNGEAVAAGLDDQGRDDGEGQRNLDREARSVAVYGLDVDRAADLFDVGLNDVHSDAATGHAGDRRRGGEAGREDELVDLRLVHLLGVELAGQPVGDHLRLDLLGVQPTPVVGDLDDDVAAFVVGGQPD